MRHECERSRRNSVLFLSEESILQLAWNASKQTVSKKTKAESAGERETPQNHEADDESMQPASESVFAASSDVLDVRFRHPQRTYYLFRSSAVIGSQQVAEKQCGLRAIP